MKKPTAVIDKNFLQGIVELSATDSKLSDELIATLTEKYQVVVTLVLIEEVVANYASLPTDQRELPRKMLDRILAFHPCWMETPLQLIFREFILKQNINADLGLAQPMAKLVSHVIENPDSCVPSLSGWVAARRQEKHERVRARVEHQRTRKQFYDEQSMRFPSLLAFMERGIQQLCVEVDPSAHLRLRCLDRYLGRNLKMLQPNYVGLIEQAFAEATFDSLDRHRFTRNYLLAEILYDLAPISEIGPNQCGHYARLWPTNPGKQINDEDDQQYVSAALACDRLLTCDAGMHKIADLFAERGIWTGKAIFVQRDKIRQLGEFLS